MKLSIFSIIFSKKGYKFVISQILCVILFSFFYWLSEHIIFKYPVLSKNLLLGEKQDDNKANPYYYWFWHSLVTQSTVGYGGITTSTGENISFINSNNNLYSVLNIFQLLSIFIIGGLFI